MDDISRNRQRDSRDREIAEREIAEPNNAAVSGRNGAMWAIAFAALAVIVLGLMFLTPSSNRTQTTTAPATPTAPPSSTITVTPPPAGTTGQQAPR